MPRFRLVSPVAPLLLFCGGCSFTFARGPETVQRAGSVQEACGNEAAVPIDFVASTAYAVRAIYVIGTHDGVTGKDTPRARAVELGATLSLAALYLGSAFYGDAINASCARADTRRTSIKPRPPEPP